MLGSPPPFLAGAAHLGKLRCSEVSVTVSPRRGGSSSRYALGALELVGYSNGRPTKSLDTARSGVVGAEIRIGPLADDDEQSKTSFEALEHLIERPSLRRRIRLLSRIWK